MKRWQKVLLLIIVVSFVSALNIVLFLADLQAHELVTNPIAERRPITLSPAYFNLNYIDIVLTTSDGFDLVGWYIPSQNGSAIIAVHGYKINREGMLEEAFMFARHGYGVILIDMRAHGESDGNLISFGAQEIQDLEAAYKYLLTRSEVDPERIGILGNSYGASISILFAAQNPNIKALVSISSYTSLDNEVGLAVQAFTPFPAFPFGPLIKFFAERESGFKAVDVSAIDVIDQISPRAVFIL